MKKILAFCLSLCLALSCTTMSVFAAEAETASTERSLEVVTPADVASVTSTNNIDYWSTYGPFYFANQSISPLIKPGAGENLKIHMYLYSGASVKISVEHNGTTRYITTWNTEGHHWADLVTNTDGGDYRVSMSINGAVDGGVYSEP